MTDKATGQSLHLIISFLLVLLCPLGQMSIDFYSTSLPSIARSFQIDANVVGVITTAYLFAYGFGQVIHGLLCDTVGRKKLLVISLPFYIIATFAPPFCQGIVAIAVARFVQGIAVAAVSVTVKAIAADIFKGDRLTKIISMLTLVWGLGPIFAPFLGSLIQTYLGWQWCFYLLGSVTILLYLGVLIFLPETLTTKKSINLSYIGIAYKNIVKNSQFWVYMFQINLAIIGLLTFITQTPDLIQNIYHFSSIGNGALLIVTSFAYVFGTQLSIFENKPSFLYLLPLVIFIVSIAMLFNYWVAIPKSVFVVFSTIIMFICGNLMPRNIAKAIQLFPKNSGLVSGFLGCITLITPGILFSLMSILHVPSFYKFALIMFIVSLITIVGAFLLKDTSVLVLSRGESE